MVHQYWQCIYSYHRNDFYMYSFGLIDNAIGTGASRFHGYTFMVLMILPLAVPAYYLLIVAITKITKHLQKH